MVAADLRHQGSSHAAAPRESNDLGGAIMGVHCRRNWPVSKIRNMPEPDVSGPGTVWGQFRDLVQQPQSLSRRLDNAGSRRSECPIQ